VTADPDQTRPLGWGQRLARLLRVGLVELHDVDILQRGLDEPIPDGPGACGLDYRVCREPDLEAFSWLGGRWRSLSRTLVPRLEQGQVCLGAFDGERGAGYLWIASAAERDRSLGLHIRPDADQLYAFDLFVAPEYRPRQVGYNLIRMSLIEGLRTGKRRALGIVLRSNRPMQMLLRAGFGFTQMRRVRSLRVLGRYGVAISGRQRGLT
jgi:GNAT superfamily N-acetyltransferase